MRFHRTIIAAVLVAAAVFSALALVAGSSAPASAAPAKAAASPEAVVREFYQWYIRTLNQNKNPRKQQATLRKYITDKFIREAAATTDADMYIDGQDYDEAWENNVRVSKATVRGDRASTEVRLIGKNFNQRLKIALRKQAGIWKIDDIRSASR